MYFILSINPNKHTVNIVGHHESLEHAIQLVAQRADEYVKSKNVPVMHRGTADEVKFTERVIYFTRTCPEHEYQIDVFRQQTQKIKGWTGASYQDQNELVRRFSYVAYVSDIGIPAAPAPPQETTAAQKTEIIKRVAPAAHTHGAQIMQSLRDNNRFKELRAAADKDKLPPPFKHIVFDSTEGEEEDSTSFE